MQFVESFSTKSNRIGKSKVLKLLFHKNMQTLNPMWQDQLQTQNTPYTFSLLRQKAEAELQVTTAASKANLGTDDTLIQKIKQPNMTVLSQKAQLKFQVEQD